MVTIKDGCGCDPCDCDWKQKLKEAYARASVSVNKVGDFDGAIYYPDGTGFVKLPIPKLSEVQQISENAQDIADLKVADVRLQANITAEASAREAKDAALDADITRIDNTDTEQDQKIQDNTDRITTVNNDLITTEATVARHNTEIINLQSKTEALSKSIVSDVMMTDGTTAGSVQVSIEKEDGAIVTSANYKWGRDIGVRLEAGTQAGYIKTVISLSDGTELESNEYKIVEILESDVYVTAITLVPDMTAGTIGGNISYSNGTTQTINSVSVPTAPGVTSAIETLQGRMTAVEQKNANQDTSITAIDGRVQALENKPGIKQFANGRLGTIAGSTTDGRIKAEDDGTGSVNGWSALKQRVSTTEGQIVTAQGDISDLDGRVGTHDTEISGIMTNISAIETKNTQQDTAINGKISIAQGSANAGKALIVGSDGNVAPGNVSGGEVWEEVDLSNFPTDWVIGDRIKVICYVLNRTSAAPSSWNTNIQDYTVTPSNTMICSAKEFTLTSGFSIYEIMQVGCSSASVTIASLAIGSAENFNGNDTFIKFNPFCFNSANLKEVVVRVNRNNLTSFVYKMWRLKK